MRGLIENGLVQDVFCSGLGAVEILEGNCLRLYFYASQAINSEKQEKLVVARLIVPTSAVPDTVLRMITADSKISLLRNMLN
jgi:hypothetical protein